MIPLNYTRGARVSTGLCVNASIGVMIGAYRRIRITFIENNIMMMMICGVSPLRGFPATRRGIGHRVPIVGGRWLAGQVRVGGGACPLRGCQIFLAGQLVGPAPTPHAALGGR